MAKKVTFKIDFDIEQQSISSLEKAISAIKEKVGEGLSDFSLTQFSLLEDKLKVISKEIEGLGGSGDPESLKRISKAIINTSKELDKLSQSAAKEVKLDVKTEEVEKAEKKMKDLRTQAEETRAFLTATEWTQSAAGTQRQTKELLDKEMSKIFTGKGGTTAWSGRVGDSLQSINSNISQFETLNKHVNTTVALYDQLKLKGKERTDEEEAKFSIINAEIKELKKVQTALTGISETVVTSNKLYENRKGDLEKQNQQLEEQIQLVETLYRKEGDASGLSEARTTATKVISTQQNKEFQVAGETERRRTEEPTINEGELPSPLDSAGMNDLIKQYFSFQAVLRMIQTAVRKTVQVIGDLDAAFVGIAVVTQYTNQEVWGMYESFRKIASGSGFSVAEIGQVGGEYFRQGESYSNVLKLTEAAAKAAQVAGISAEESVRYLTSAIKGYNLAASEAMDVSDKFAAVAAYTATDYDGLATAMSKVASQAYANNVEMDNLMGLLATSMEVTQEAPENIGTAFKTIFARMSEIKDYGKVLEDGINANNIQKALATVNVELFDVSGNMRALDTVLIEVGAQWDTLNQSQKAYLATTLAGTRQQTRLLSVFENYDMLLENIEASQNSAGATEAQQRKNMEGIAHQINRINVAYEGMTNSLAQGRGVAGLVGGLADSIEFLGRAVDSTGGKVAVYSAGIVAMTVAISALNKVAKEKGLTNWLTSVMANAGLSTTAVSGLGNAAVVAGAKVATITATVAPWLILGGALLGAGSAMGLFDSATTKATKKVEKFADAISEIDANLYNINEARDNLEKLSDEYKTLRLKVYKTNEEMERMSEILQLIKDTDLEGVYQFENSEGLDFHEINIALEDLERQEREQWEERYKEGLKMVRMFNKITSATERYNVAQSMAIKGFANGNYDAWMEFDQATQHTLTRLAEKFPDLAAPIRTYFTSDGEVYTGKTQQIGWKVYSTRTESYGYGASARTREIVDYSSPLTYTEEAIPEGIADQVIAFEKWRSSVDMNTISIEEYNKATRNFFGDFADQYAQIDAATRSLSNFNGIVNISVNEFAKLDSVLKQMIANGAQLDESVIQKLVSAFDSGGIQGMISALWKSARASEEVGIGMGDIVNLANQLIDVFDEMTFDQLIDGLQTFESMAEKIHNINDGLENMNYESLESVIALLDQYPEVSTAMVDSILATGKISEDVQKQMLAAESERMRTSIRNEIEQNEIRIKIAEETKKMFESALANEKDLEALAADATFDINQMTSTDVINHLGSRGQAYADHFNEIIRLAGIAGQEIIKGLEGDGVQSNLVYGSRDSGAYSVEEQSLRLDKIREKVTGYISSANSEILKLTETNRLLELSYSKISDGTWGALKRDSEAAKEAKEEVEEYLGALNKLYVAQKRLEFANWGLGILKAKEAYNQAADAVRGLAGAQETLRDSTLAQTVEDQYAGYEVLKDQLTHIIDVSEEYQQDLINKLNPALKSSFTVINGQIIPVSKEYKKLTFDQMKVVDEFADSFNKLGKEIEGYTTELYNAETAQNQLIKTMHDTLIEYQELLIGAIQNQEKKQIEAFRKIIDENKKYLEERKKLYEDAFSEQDQDEQASSIAEERQKVIEKLANLEAAHDVTSVQKRKEYQEQLRDLDDQYNQLALERNREALLQSIDDQINYQEEIYQKEEEAYQARIESAEWLEARVKEIQDGARLQAIIDSVGHNWTIQQLLDNGYITQDLITKAGITNLNQTITDLSATQLGIFESYWGQNRDVIDNMWNQASGEVGAVKLSEMAMDKILEYLTEHSDQMEGKTSTMKKAVLNEWKSLMTSVNEYTESFNAITLKAPDYSAVTKGVNQLVSDLKKAADTAELQYQRMQISTSSGSGSGASSSGSSRSGSSTTTAATTYRYGTATSKLAPNATASTQSAAINQWGRSSKIYRFTYKGGTFQAGSAVLVHDPTKKTTSSGSGGGTYAGIPTMSAFATGGTTERTGFHWLDGKPGAPERVLSPGQNRQFESLLGELTLEANNRSNQEEVVSALTSVVSAIYESSEENAERIGEALSKGETTGTQIRRVIEKHGISTNAKRYK